MTTLQKTDQKSLIIDEWERDLALVKSMVAKGTTDDEFKLFCYQAKRTGLDPLSRQIYAIMRSGKMTIQTAIDGFRVVANRTGLYAGNDDPVFDNEKTPMKATVTVYKIVQGVRCPFTASARMDQYRPTCNADNMWRKMPHLMLGKCAEALALRKAFPADLSGMYIDEEMEQANVVQTTAEVKTDAKPKTVEAKANPAPVTPPKDLDVNPFDPKFKKVNEKEVNYVHAELKSIGVSFDMLAVKERIREITGKLAIEDFTEADKDAVLDYITKKKIENQKKLKEEFEKNKNEGQTESIGSS